MTDGGIPSSTGTDNRRYLSPAGLKASGECLKLLAKSGLSICGVICSLGVAGVVKSEFSINLIDFGGIAAGYPRRNNSPSRNPNSLAYCSSPFRVVQY